jgi:hypothetical protein
MFFFVSFGTKVRQEERGVVADRCPTCDRVRRFAVTEHSSSFHLYHIPIGGWKREAVVAECFCCARRFDCDPDAYDDVLPDAEAAQLTLGELVEQTNSRLLRTREEIRWQPEGSGLGRPSSEEPDAPILTALPAETAPRR